MDVGGPCYGLWYHTGPAHIAVAQGYTNFHYPISATCYERCKRKKASCGNKSPTLPLVSGCECPPPAAKPVRASDERESFEGLLLTISK